MDTQYFELETDSATSFRCLHRPMGTFRCTYHEAILILAHPFDASIGSMGTHRCTYHEAIQTLTHPFDAPPPDGHTPVYKSLCDTNPGTSFRCPTARWAHSRCTNHEAILTLAHPFDASTARWAHSGVQITRRD